MTFWNKIAFLDDVIELEKKLNFKHFHHSVNSGPVDCKIFHI